MVRACIDTSVYKSHSVRAAASSQARISSVPISEIISVARWSNIGTFTKFYQNKVRHEEFFCTTVIKY
ncbi:hypothetical protein DPMN_010010 [Dreissena polymorpha]|uniref:Uncharacterized protein n=1 Tax=Dreissena polymorpha TaxID=45954 RepID=A0A9D4N2B9_DREPO|nr:hypothetical protein DPMN_010010 [Dreissena polymorpha]